MMRNNDCCNTGKCDQRETETARIPGTLLPNGNSYNQQSQSKGKRFIRKISGEEDEIGICHVERSCYSCDTMRSTNFTKEQIQSQDKHKTNHAERYYSGTIQ